MRNYSRIHFFRHCEAVTWPPAVTFGGTISVRPFAEAIRFFPFGYRTKSRLLPSRYRTKPVQVTARGTGRYTPSTQNQGGCPHYRSKIIRDI